MWLNIHVTFIKSRSGGEVSWGVKYNVTACYYNLCTYNVFNFAELLPLSEFDYA